MSLLVTIGLVLIGAVCLVVGFATNSLALIYVSIACSLLAAIVLVVFSRMSKRDSATGATAPAGRSQQTWSPPAPPAPASAGSWSPSETPSSFSAPPPAPPRTVDEPTARTPVWEPEPAEEPPAEPEPVPSAAGATTTGADDDFPIPRYDDLRVSQIQPLLGRLDLDDLDLVREREELGKNRPTLLRMIDSRIDALERQAGTAAPPAGDMADEDLADEDDLADGDDDLLDLDDEPAPPAAAPDEEPEPEVEEEFQAPFVAGPAAPADDGFPIADYDERSVAEIIGMLDDLDNDELDMVAEREELGQNRAAILDAIDAMFDDDEEEAPPAPPPPPVSRGPAKRGAAKAAMIKASPVTKPPAKKAVPAKAPPRKAAPVVKSPPTRSPAAKAPTAKIAAAKVAAAKAAPVKRAASARKTAPPPAAAPVKKAIRARKSASTEPAPAPVKKAAPRTPRGR